MGMFNNQELLCNYNCKSVSGNYAFEKGKSYVFAVIQHSDDYECVLKFPNNEGELVDTRCFSDYDTSFIDEPYFELVDKKTLAAKDKKGRDQTFKSVLCGGSKEECSLFLSKLLENKDVNYNTPTIAMYTDEKQAFHSVCIEELG